MSQQRLNHLMICSVYKDELNELNLIDVLKEFSTASDTRKSRYGTFVESDFA